MKSSTSLPNFLCALLIMSNQSFCAYDVTPEPSTNSKQGGSVPQMTAPSTPNGADAPEWRKEAWQHLTSNGQYRVARADDFRIPESVVIDRYTKLDIERALHNPFIVGDINNDGLAQDLAVIVVDISRSEQERFGLVIFNEPADNNLDCRPHWVFKERDLSRTVLSWWSGGLNVRNYEEDGSSNLLYVNWDNQKQVYFYDKLHRR